MMKVACYNGIQGDSASMQKGNTLPGTGIKGKRHESVMNSVMSNSPPLLTAFPKVWYNS
jgi:hypothetical protein